MRRISLAFLIAGLTITTTLGCADSKSGPVEPVKPVLPENTDTNTKGGESVLPEEGP